MTEAFIEELEKQYAANLEGLSPLQKTIRQKAWERFTSLGPPKRKSDGFHYFPTSQLYQKKFEKGKEVSVNFEEIYSYILPECRGSCLVFVNGRYRHDLSRRQNLPSEVVILPLSEALSTYGTFLQGRVVRHLKEENDPFGALNIALLEVGLFVYIPKEVKVSAPIQCLHISSHNKPTIFSPRIQLFLGAHSQLEWISDVKCHTEGEFVTNRMFDIALEEGASLKRTSLITPCCNAWYFGGVRVTQKSNSQFTNISFLSGSKATREDFRIALLGENAFADLKGVSLVDRNKSAHSHVHIEHAEPSTRSSQHFKKIVADGGSSSFEGKIYVKAKAQKTEAYQLNNNLLLGERAQANSKPSLEIFADDVKASHGATTTQLHPDQLHYLNTRGLPEKQARQLLVKGFATEITQNITQKGVRDTTTNLIERFSS